MQVSGEVNQLSVLEKGGKVSGKVLRCGLPWGIGAGTEASWSEELAVVGVCWQREMASQLQHLVHCVLTSMLFYMLVAPSGR